MRDVRNPILRQICAPGIIVTIVLSLTVIPSKANGCVIDDAIAEARIGNDIKDRQILETIADKRIESECSTESKVTFVEMLVLHRERWLSQVSQDDLVKALKHITQTEDDHRAIKDRISGHNGPDASNRVTEAWDTVDAWWKKADRVVVDELVPSRNDDSAGREGPWSVTVTKGDDVKIEWKAYNERDAEIDHGTFTLEADEICGTQQFTDNGNGRAKLKATSGDDTLPCRVALSFVYDDIEIEEDFCVITVEAQVKLRAQIVPKGELFMIVGDNVVFRDSSIVSVQRVARDWIVNGEAAEKGDAYRLKAEDPGRTTVARALTAMPAPSTGTARSDTATAVVHVLPSPRLSDPWGLDDEGKAVFRAPAEVRVELANSQIGSVEGVTVGYEWSTVSMDLDQLTLEDEPIDPVNPRDPIQLTDSGVYRLEIQYELIGRDGGPKDHSEVQRYPYRRWFRVHEPVSWNWTWASGAVALAGGASALWFHTRANAHFDDHVEFAEALQVEDSSRAWDDYVADISRRDVSWGVFWAGVTAAAVTWYWKVRRPQARNHLIDDVWEKKSSSPSARFEVQPAFDGVRLGLSRAY